MKVNYLGGARYYVEFIDDRSEWCEVRFLKSKVEVYRATKEYYIAFVENRQGKTVKCLQSDNGGEYSSLEFKEYTARCLILDSKLPQSFWAEAVNTANYIRNHLESKSLNGRTPYGVWMYNVPDLSHIRTFGCRVFYLNREPGKGKFDQHGQEGIFLGYSQESKGFRIWSPEKKKALLSREVKFIEEGKDNFKGNLDAPSKIKTEIENSGQAKRFVDSELTLPSNTENLPNIQHFSLSKRESDEKEYFSEFRDASELLQPDDQEDFSEEEEQGFNDNADARPSLNETRGRGTPRLIRTGQPWYPSKQYQPGNSDRAEIAELNEEIFLSVVPMKEAMKGSNATEWHQAIFEEIKSIIKKDTWTLVDRRAQGEVISCRMIFRNKLTPDGTLERRKARLVVQGFNQTPGIHFSETFAPVARIGSICIMTSLTARYGMNI